MVADRQVTPADFEPLDMDELKALPNELKDKYMLLERLFGDKSWEYVKAWCQKSADQQVMILLQAPNWDQTVYARGKRDAFIELLNLEKGVAFEFRHILFEKAQQEQELQQSQEESDNE
jgi:hypothetical protein